MNEKLVLTFNTGSSTVKIGLYRIAQSSLERIGHGVIDFRTAPLRLTWLEGPEPFAVDLTAIAGEELDAVLEEAFGHLSEHFDLGRITAVGHRVVHGGDRLVQPVTVDDAALSAMEALIPLAPLHQPQALRLIRSIARLRPAVRQVASFDTAFHATNADVVRRLALPRHFHDEGIKRYGFHGLSYRSIVETMRTAWPQQVAGKVVVAHLGSGASLCAIENGISLDTSMGFSTLDGVPMATRCGAIDPGAILHLSQRMGDAKLVEKLLYAQSGLLGVSGISADSRELLASDREEAREALDLFTFRTAGEVARLAATLGGLECLVFTAGIGEHQPQIRADICARLAWLGLELDAAANSANEARITTLSSRVLGLVIPTDEERVIAEDALKALSA